MAHVSYCKKCRAEVPLGDSCPQCGTKLTKASERLSFGVRRLPVKDWFCWNSMLRVMLPVMLLVLLMLLLIELSVAGAGEILGMLTDGVIWLILGAFALIALGCLLILALQGRESVHYVLDRDGAHAYTYLKDPTRLMLYARLLSPSALEALRENEQNQVPGLTLISARHILWQDVKRVRFWRENGRILFYHPSFWLYLPVTATGGDYDEAEAMIRKKLGRNKRVRLVGSK